MVKISLCFHVKKYREIYAQKDCESSDPASLITVGSVLDVRPRGCFWGHFVQHLLKDVQVMHYVQPYLM